VVKYRDTDNCKSEGAEQTAQPLEFVEGDRALRKLLLNEIDATTADSAAATDYMP